MNAKNTTEETEKEQIVDNISNESIAAPSQEAVDMNKLAALKAKNQAKQAENKVPEKKKERSLNLGVIGTGQAGGNLAVAMKNLGYNVVAINTAQQDLKHLDLDDSCKLLLEYGVGGAAKELEIGKAAAEAYRSQIAELINDHLTDSQVNILCLSLGGGSGAGSCEILVDILSEIGKPIVVMCVLPMESDDSATKSNSIETLAKLAKLAQIKKIHNLICIDNAKLESIYANISQMDFFNVANKGIVEPIDVFNTLSAMPSSYKALDSMEFSKLLIDGEGLSVFGHLKVSNFEEDTAIAEAIINSLNSNLLASGFDLKQAKYAGMIISAPKSTWQRIPNSSISYATTMLGDFCSNPKAIFKGIYVIDGPDNVVNIFSFFSGLSLPDSRIEQLKKDVKIASDNSKSKDEVRNLSLKIDTGTEETVSNAQKIKNQIAAKSSAFGKFVSGTVDRRSK